MGKLHTFKQEEINKIIDLYEKQKVSLDNIANLFDVGREVIRRVLVENNIHIRNAKDLYGKTVSEEIQQKVIYNYVQLGMGLVPSGKPYGLGQFMVKKILIENGVYVRSYTESKDNLRKYSCNDDYFKTQSPNMAYILGFLAADGNVAKKENQINIQLEEKDAEVLEKIRREMSISRPLKVYPRSGEPDKKIAKLVVFSSSMKKDLAHYSIVPAKTFSLMPPELLKPEYYIDYIRGYFDGDGCICENIAGSGSVSFGGASKSVISWIRKVLAEEYGIICNKIEENKELSNGGKFYRISYHNKKIIQFYKVMYHNKDIIYMKRKKDKFEELLMKYYPRDYESLVKD